MNRILIVRGGAIGDFILTLPALRALRQAYPSADIEVHGYKHIAVLAHNPFYADSIRSIEYGKLSSFFARNSDLPAELANHFASFDLVISYLYDPDRIFAANLQRCGVEQFLRGPAKIEESQHAIRQLVRPVEELGITVTDLSIRVFPSTEDQQFADHFVAHCSRPVVALHPGSGSERKNWPLKNWIKLGNDLLGRHSLIVVGGEADEAQTARLKQEWKNQPNVIFAENLQLPQLAAILSRTAFVGHDSGISHLAAAGGANCVLLFGPTSPEVWAPLNPNVRVLRAPSRRMEDIQVANICRALPLSIGRTASVPS